ncbi:MAG: hypothetical protein C4520_16330 [Candidatus Abyssobacteria bacterium SURF_5]|uniref:Uncharacterized protein n=1 Tax=Abyssobacteria bacterium (strain SURF_5) TaxID=2093360 RepID=A0A3A4NK30_ABYX5|nr:MAG: hypothetical protein C4520_16330 [Candidatus Abyssubacteria bacterium SURF_5]
MLLVDEIQIDLHEILDLIGGNLGCIHLFDGWHGAGRGYLLGRLWFLSHAFPPPTATLHHLDINIHIDHPINVSKNIFRKLAGKALNGIDNMLPLLCVRAFSHYLLVKLKDVPCDVHVVLAALVTFEQQHYIELLDQESVNRFTRRTLHVYERQHSLNDPLFVKMINFLYILTHQE